MSAQDQVETMELLPNRLAVAAFVPEEVDVILGGNEYENRLRSENFNWIAAYLCEEVGIFEHEIVDWFRSGAQGLGGESPLAVWQDREDGFWRVFEYAQQYKRQVEQDIGVQDPSDPNVFRSSGIAENALKIISDGFKIAGVEISPNGQSSDGMRCETIHNPDNPKSPTVRWKGDGRMEDYRVILDEGQRMSTFFIVRYLPENEEPFIVQTGIGRRAKMLGEDRNLVIDTDLDGRPPSAGEVASFVVPLSNEVNNRSLVSMQG